MTSRVLVVLAGGENSRLRPLSTTIYKAFLPIHGASQVARHIVEASLASISMVAVYVDEPDPLVTAIDADCGDVQVAARIIPGSPAEKICAAADEFGEERPLLVCLGDTVARVDLRQLRDAPARCQVDSALAVAPYRLPAGFLNIKESLVTSFVEKPTTRLLVNTGYMALGPGAIDLLSEVNDLARCLQQLAVARQLAATRSDGPMVAVDDFVSLADAHALLDPRAARGEPVHD